MLKTLATIKASSESVGFFDQTRFTINKIKGMAIENQNLNNDNTK